MKLDAVLLVGPSGSGKTPLGQYCQAHGLWGRPCHHFDFGENLRQTAAGRLITALSEADVAYVRKVLEEGALLTNDTFHIAEAILHGFISEHVYEPDPLLLLNGLPRHTGQAEDLQETVAVSTVIQLHCSPETVQKRIQKDTGGDRGERTDDSLDYITKKLTTYSEQTLPLIDWYRENGAKIITLPVDTATSAQQVHQQLEGH